MQMTTFTRWLYVCLAGLILFGGCAKDENEPTMQREQLPLEAQTFLTRFFPDQLSLEIKKMTAPDSHDTEGYQVTLANETSVTFDESGGWLHVAAPNGDFPETFDTFFTEGMKECVRQKYPGDGIVGITRTFFGDVLTLQSNKQLAFQTYQDTFLGEVLPEYSQAELPSAICTFVSTHFPESPYQWIIQNTTAGNDLDFAYQIWLKGNVKLNFDTPDTWNELDAFDHELPASILLTLPQEVQEYLATYHSLAEITYISLSNSTSYTIRVDKQSLVVIDTEKNSNVIYMEKIEAFINKYFSGSSTYSASHPANPDDAWALTINLPNGFDITLDKDYQWLGMDGNGYPVPESANPLFPGRIREYIATHATGKISKVQPENTNYHVVLTDGQGFLFDQLGEFVANEEVSFTPYEKTYRYIRYHFPEKLKPFYSFTGGKGWTYTFSDQTQVKFDMEGNLIVD